MNEAISANTVLILLVGLVVIASGLIEAGFQKLRVPALVGYLLLGVLMSLANSRWTLITEPVRHSFSFLADLGVIALLFKVGLQSHPGSLARKLPQAIPLWLGNVVASALFGFATAYWLLDLKIIPSLIIATALTATSIGVSVDGWQRAQALESGNGQLMLDVAELDDISAIALMALLFALIPTLHQGQGAMVSALGLAGAGFVAKFSLFLGFCYLFSNYLEPLLTGFTMRLEPEPQRMLTVIGLGFIIAAFASWLGFSLAIGALFAGLVFSRDPQAIRTEKSFTDIYAFLTPFFFINIGLNVMPDHIVSGAGLGLLLLIAAALGKLIGAGTPALITSGLTGAALLGVSMIPRAEIAMIVVHQAQQVGDWVLPERVYAAMVFVSITTCIIAPWILYLLLQRWPQSEEDSS